MREEERERQWEQYYKADNIPINVTLRCVRVTTVAVEKQEVLHVLCVCVCVCACACVCVALVIQRVMGMRRIILSSVTCLALL
jgi:hypothetical protein